MTTPYTTQSNGVVKRANSKIMEYVRCMLDDAGPSKKYWAFAVSVAVYLNTGKNDLTRRVTHREAVFGTVIHSIFDAWHYEVLWTNELTTLL
jgi:hypothetical protein